MADIEHQEKKAKLVAIRANNEETPYVSPIVPEIFKYAQEYIQENGCSEVQILVRTGDNLFSEFFDCGTRTDEGLGAFEKYKALYSYELLSEEDLIE